jgi:hypothetical protein
MTCVFAFRSLYIVLCWVGDIHTLTECLFSTERTTCRVGYRSICYYCYYNPHSFGFIFLDY